MSVNRNTHIITSDLCNTCKGIGTVPQLDESVQAAPPTEECRKCKGTGRKLIKISELIDLIDQDIATRLRRQGMHPAS